jgi:hypothetical protein
MTNLIHDKRRRLAKVLAVVATAGTMLAGLLPTSAQAIPLFNRQTGQNCVACHAGGQFPELTPYGRLFKLTGYTLGTRSDVPVSAMVLANLSHVANTSKSDDPAADFNENNKVIVSTASLFLGGKITDNVGAFVQVTYDPYASQGADGTFHGHASADNMDFRFADRFIDDKQDLIYGVSLNNNPSVSDVWNTVPAWMQYVPVPGPSSSQFIDGTTPFPGYAAGGGTAGLTAYAFLNRTWYGEIGAYATSRGLLSFMSGGNQTVDKTKLQGLNPYVRLAWNHEWGAHSLMVGGGAMRSKIYDDPTNTSDSSTINHVTDINLDTQYQYLLDPHTVTAQFVVGRSTHKYPAGAAGQAVDFVSATGAALPLTNATDTTNVMRAKVSYVYRATYGGSLALFNLSGNTNTANQSSGYDPETLTITSDPLAGVPSTRVNGNLSGNPGSRGWTQEIFWTPVQYVRIGAQYTAYTRYNGASKNYDGFGRNASDNNTLFVYLWAAY